MFTSPFTPRVSIFRSTHRMTARSQRSTAAKQIAAAAAATTTTSSSSSNPKSKATSSSPPSAEKNGASAAHTEFTKFYLTQIPETLSIADQSVMLQICLKHGSITGFNYLKAERIIDVGFVDSKSAKSCFEEFLNECPQLSCNRVHPVLDLEASKKRSQDQLNNNTDENSEGSDHASSKRLKISETETKGDEGDQLTENMLEDYNEHEPNTAIERSAENPAEHNDDEEPEDELGETLFNQNSLKFNAQRNASNPYSTVANGMKNPGCNEEDEDHIYERELKEEENKSEVVTDRQSTQDQQKDHTNSAPLIPDQSPKNQGKSKPGQLLKTCVIHVRNLPDSYNKNDLCRLMISYGKITHCVFMKSQAFIEYRNFTDASNLVEMCKRYQLKFHNQKIIAQFSVHERLEKSEAHSANNKKTEQLLQNLWNDIGQEDKSFLGCSVLVAFVDNMTLPINHQALHEIFSKYGRVLKIKIVKPSSPNQFKAFVQMENPFAARHASHATDKQYIYSNANFITVNLLKMKELVLNSSPDVECFDYTTSGNMIASNQLQHVEPDRPGLLRNYPHQSDSQYRHDSYANEDPSPYNRSDNHTSFSGQFNDSALSYGKYRDSQYDSSNQYPARSNSFREQSYSDSQSSFMDHSDTGSAQGKVILLSNLASDREGLKERVDNIFTLFSTVGQVNKVKILFKTPDKAFIEFDTEHQANNAVSMMNLAYLQGRRCSVALSKVSQITIKPQDNQDYFRDYRNSRRHRFIGKGTKHLQNIFPPSPKLHLSNLPRSITEVDIRQMFQGNESEIKNMNVLADRHMAFVELTSVALAVDYLIRLHDTKFGDLTMKVSFAKP